MQSTKRARSSSGRPALAPEVLNVLVFIEIGTSGGFFSENDRKVGLSKPVGYNPSGCCLLGGLVWFS